MPQARTSFALASKKPTFVAIFSSILQPVTKYRLKESLLETENSYGSSSFVLKLHFCFRSNRPKISKNRHFFHFFGATCQKTNFLWTNQSHIGKSCAMQTLLFRENKIFFAFEKFLFVCSDQVWPKKRERHVIFFDKKKPACKIYTLKKEVL